MTYGTMRQMNLTDAGALLKNVVVAYRLPRMNMPRMIFAILFAVMVLLLPPRRTTGAEQARAAAGHQAVEHARILIDQGHFAQAQQVLEPWLAPPHSLASLPFLQACALLYQRQNDALSEAAMYHDILRLAPQDSSALRGRVFATQRMGAPHLAATFAAQTPELFSGTEMRHLQQSLAGKSIQWGTAESAVDLGPQRFQATDRAIEQNAAVSGADAVGQRASFDRLVALRDRVRMDEAIALYHALTQQHVELPAYALAAAAEAYAYKREPERARDLYLQALALSQNDPDYPNRAWQFGLFEAYMDANAFEAARQLMEQLQQEIPPIIHKGLPGVERDNDFYGRARVNAARVRLAANALAESQRMLEHLGRAAPFNLETRLTSADLLQARELPRAAQEQYVSVRVDDPSNLDATVGIAETALGLYDLGTATAQRDVLMAHYPENRAVQRLQRELQAYARPRFTLTSETGFSGSGAGNTGNSDWQIATTFLSAPFANHWRCKRSGCQNITLAITSFDGVPCRHGYAPLLTMGTLGTDSA